MEACDERIGKALELEVNSSRMKSVLLPGIRKEKEGKS